MSERPSGTHILFADQGRGNPHSAMGHVRARHALDTGRAQSAQGIRISFASVPPLTRAQRRRVKVFPWLGTANMWSVRFAMTRSWLARRMLEECVRRDRPDVIQLTTDQVAFLLGRLRTEPPCALSLDSLYIDWVRMTNNVANGARTPWYLWPIEKMERHALRRAPLTVAWTQTIARRARILAPGARVTVLHPGIDLQAFAPPATARDSGGGPVRVLFVGGVWGGRKGGPHLLEALGSRLGSDVELDVLTAVDLPPTNGVHTHHAAPGSPVVARLFAQAHVLCLPSLADACPWVVVEALGSGLPVVSTTVGSIAEMVGDGGVVVEPGNVGALRQALNRLIDDPSLRQSMGERGRARAEEHYDARKNAPRLVEILRDVAHRHSPNTASTTRIAALPSSR